MLSELNPCPFCGKSAELECEEDHHGGFFKLGCPDKECCAHWMYYTEPIENRDEAISAWNRRAEAAESALAESSKEKVEEMVNRFLWWPLPQDFSPDCGIKFTPIKNQWPAGTSLFTATQARLMILHMLDELDENAAAPASPAALSDEQITAIAREYALKLDLTADKVDAIDVIADAIREALEAAGVK